jgi:hypothetical protein
MNMEEYRKKINQSLGVIFLSVLVLAATLAVFLYSQSNGLAEKKEIVAPTELYDAPKEIDEDDSDKNMTQYITQDIFFNYPVGWYIETEGDFITITNWDSSVTPERGLDGLRLVIGRLGTDMALDQYVGDYLNQNIRSDPSYNLLGRKATTLGGLPGVLVQATTELEGGAAIQSAFTFFEDEVWSIDIVGTVLDREMQDIFDHVTASFTFLKFVPKEETEEVASEEINLLIEEELNNNEE